jgi:hypothetical protein
MVMKNVKSAFAFALLAGAAILVPGAASADNTPIGQSPTPISTVQSQLRVSLLTVPVACSGSGSSDVASRNHTIKNTTGHTIPKGTSLHWTASNSGSGNVALTSDLAPNGTVSVIEPGQTNGYTCTATFVPPSADLVLKSVAWSNDTTATVVIQNTSPWRDVGATTLRLQRMKCLSTQVSTQDAPTAAIAKGQSITVTVNAARAGADYLQATANATSSPSEPNTANNVNKSFEFGTNKSCTPQ